MPSICLLFHEDKVEKKLKQQYIVIHLVETLFIVFWIFYFQLIGGTNCPLRLQEKCWWMSKKQLIVVLQLIQQNERCFTKKLFELVVSSYDTFLCIQRYNNFLSLKAAKDTILGSFLFHWCKTRTLQVWPVAFFYIEPSFKQE